METKATVSTIKLMNQDLVRLDLFDGSNITHWQDKLKFLLTALKIFYVLDPNLVAIPKPKDDDNTALKEQRKKRQEDELTCRGHILNALSNRLYDLYTDNHSTKEIWNSLEYKYKVEEEEMSLEDIQKHLRIEEESRSRDKNDDSYAGHSKANAINKPNNSNKHKEKFLGPKKDHRKFKKSQNNKKNGGYFVYGKPRHYAQDYKFRKKQDEEAKVNAIEEDIVSTMSEINVVYGKVQG
ncbi:hypothetical protein LWI28_000207 [Acer negundo]|uniref:Uncharacterized protein n=1 Tax=Acer negundo TaxID=4023 RepID=A0AAD5INH7_ACENE|nr:hypothetical protein LWI28_000207 [Acer negundo]